MRRFDQRDHTEPGGPFRPCPPARLRMGRRRTPSILQTGAVARLPAGQLLIQALQSTIQVPLPQQRQRTLQPLKLGNVSLP